MVEQTENRSGRRILDSDSIYVRREHDAAAVRTPLGGFRAQAGIIQPEQTRPSDESATQRKPSFAPQITRRPSGLGLEIENGLSGPATLAISAPLAVSQMRTL